MRILTESEQDNLLDFIKPNPYIPLECAMNIVNIEKKMFKDQLSEIEISEEIIPELKEEMRKKYALSKIDSGNMVGIIAASSIGADLTQAMLNNFHSAGLAGKTTDGMARITELMNTTKKPKLTNYNIYFLEKPDNMDKLYSIMNTQIVGVFMEEIIETWKVLILTEDNIDEWEEPWYEMYEKLYDDTFRNCDGVIHFEINKMKLVEFSLTLEAIAKSLHTQYIDLTCVWSPPNFSRLDIFFRMDTFDIPESQIKYINHENYTKICLEEALLPVIKSCKVSGISGIDNVHPIKNIQNNSDVTEWYFTSTGDNIKNKSKINTFKALLSLYDIVDTKRVMSNNMWDIYESFGIEAAREFIIEEYMNMMAGINVCHIETLVNRMTFGGIPSAIHRFSMSKNDGGWVSKISFEEPSTHIKNAAMRGEFDLGKSVSMCTFVGKRANSGSGKCKLKPDLDMLTELNELKNNSEKLSEEINEESTLYTENVEDNQDTNSDDLNLGL